MWGCTILNPSPASVFNPSLVNSSYISESILTQCTVGSTSFFFFLWAIVRYCGRKRYQSVTLYSEQCDMLEVMTFVVGIWHSSSQNSEQALSCADLLLLTPFMYPSQITTELLYFLETSWTSSNTSSYEVVLSLLPTVGMCVVCINQGQEALIHFYWL